MEEANKLTEGMMLHEQLSWLQTQPFAYELNKLSTSLGPGTEHHIWTVLAWFIYCNHSASQSLTMRCILNSEKKRKKDRNALQAREKGQLTSKYLWYSQEVSGVVFFPQCQNIACTRQALSQRAPFPMPKFPCSVYKSLLTPAVQRLRLRGEQTRKGDGRGAAIGLGLGLTYMQRPAGGLYWDPRNHQEKDRDRPTLDLPRRQSLTHLSGSLGRGFT